ncbi:hypothetical protein HKCCSP123_10765 [Rhodobacterales bacterium HKCCSP123]|nr:hypothetical protein [Rhodobacterales bacterium HKCCSP123]
MKTLLGTALIAALLAGTAVRAQEIRPLETTASSQSRIIELGAVPTGVIVLGTFVVGGVVFAIVGASDGT